MKFENARILGMTALGAVAGFMLGMVVMTSEPAYPLPDTDHVVTVEDFRWDTYDQDIRPRCLSFEVNG